METVTGLQADELRGYALHSSGELPELTIPRLIRRITAGIQARTTSLTACLEHGRSPEVTGELGGPEGRSSD
ncbi:hypothetical protein [Streptomyces sp. NPDC059994]|uniref:hypothetical protein n=1 Tax=Streptomyces sp. NPDC059994 TaxID=3347029 RepID=UPI00367D57D7